MGGAALSEAAREAVIAAYPERIGQGDGLPADARDQANRVMLDDDLARLAAKDEDGTISPLERKVLANAGQARDSLANADAYTDPLDPDVKPGGTLWLYDPAAYDGDGRVAVAVGDLDHASDVAVFTPGINTDMGDTTSYTDKMMNLYESTRYNGDGGLTVERATGHVESEGMSTYRAEDYKATAVVVGEGAEGDQVDLAATALEEAGWERTAEGLDASEPWAQLERDDFRTTIGWTKVGERELLLTLDQEGEVEVPKDTEPVDRDNSEDIPLS